MAIRVLLSKVGLDGHDRGIKVIASALRDAGMEVIYTGLHKRPNEIVNAAIQEDVDVLGISILSGAHMTLVPKVLEQLQNQNAGDCKVLVGGIIPDDDEEELKEMGVEEVFGPGTSLDKIVSFIENAVE